MDDFGGGTLMKLMIVLVGSNSFSHVMEGRHVTAIPAFVTANVTEEFLFEKSTDAPSVQYYKQQDHTTPENYRDAICSERCRNGVVVRSEQIACSSFSCFPCSCLRPGCEIMGNCCPDYTEDITDQTTPINNNGNFRTNLSWSSILPDVATTPSEQQISRNPVNKPKENLQKMSSGIKPSGGDSQRVTCDERYYWKNKLLSIRSCPENFPSLDIKSLCDQDVAGDQLTRKTETRVTDNSTGVTYHNWYCSVCNNATQPVTWSLRVDCNHCRNVFSATDKDELLRLAAQDESACDITQTLPEDVTPVIPCAPSWFRPAIDSCNVTGQWAEFDEDIRQACEDTAGFHDCKNRVRDFRQDKNRVYKNVFCAVCNSGSFPGLGNCSDSDELKGSYGTKLDNRFSPPFSFLLNVGEPHSKSPIFKEQFGECKDNLWLSGKGCDYLSCTKGKVLQNGRCVSALSQVRGLGYNVRLWFVPTKDLHYQIVTGSFYSKINEIHDALNVTMQWSVLGVMRVLMESRTKTFISPAVFSALFPLTDFVLWLDAAIMADKHISRDEFERLAVKYFFSDDISLNLTYNSNLELKVLPMSNEVQPASFCYMPRVLCRVREVKLRDNLPYNPVQTRQEIRKNFLRLSPLRVCTQIRFNSSEYSIEYGAKNSGDPVFPVSKITFVLPFATVTLATLEDFHQIEFSYKGILSICSDFLINKLGRNGFDVPNSINDVETNQYILTVICISISILCLALTVSSYCFFPVLCNTAGLNNVSLCLTLLFAQVALVVAVHLQKYLPQGGLVCIGSGILTHFLWLCMFCWSFVCCFRIFKVFTSETRLNRMPWITRKCELGKSWAFCLIVPCVIIGAVTAVSYTITKGHSIGYSRCYLDSAMLIGLAMMMPIGLVVLGNLIFFSVTIVKIRSVLQLHPGRTNGRNEEKNLFCVYIKLSFLTGAFWTLAIVSEVLDSDPLRYMGIVTNGLQGVFIFVSYACNPRVIGLYKQKFGISNR